MEHEWFKDKNYNTHNNSSIIGRELCTQCYCYRYWWSRIENGLLKVHYYIMDKDTQYGHIHKCNSELIKNWKLF